MKNGIESLILSGKERKLNNADTQYISNIIMSIIDDDIVSDYFFIIGQYQSQKKSKGLNAPQISDLSGVPESTIRRTENLRNIPNVTNLMKMLRTVGLKLTVEPVCESRPQPININ